MDLVLPLLVALSLLLAVALWARERSLRRRLGPIRQAVDSLLPSPSRGEGVAARDDHSPTSAGEAAERSRGSATPGDELSALATSVRTLQAALQQERREERSEHLEREILRAHISDGVALIDRDDRILHANRAFGALFGRPVAPDPGSPLSDVLRHPEVLEIVHAARGGTLPLEREIRLRGSETRAIEIRATQIESEIAGSVLLVVRDLTERERQIRIRQDFVANVSHELRTPLTSILGYAETLLDGGLEDEANRSRFVGVIRDQAARLQELVEDLLSLAELERAGHELRLTRFDLRSLGRAQVAAFREPASIRRLSLRIEEGPPVEVLGDRSRIEQVFANLLDNAIKYTEKGGIRIEVGGDEDTAWAAVEDTGIGIPAAEQARIFERFYRVDKARSRAQGGTGLGLAIVKHILVQHHGEITVESTPAGGSRFQFRLPR